MKNVKGISLSIEEALRGMDSHHEALIESHMINTEEPILKRKCYISGKISGEYESVVFANFGLAKRNIELGGIFEAVSPTELEHDHEYANKLPEYDKWAYYMDNCIKALLRCDAIFMLKNWGQSKGARVERAIAIELGLEIIYQ